MSAIPKLGVLSTLRATDVWGNEPQVFTPWLSQNLGLLADALQIDELQLKGTEVPAGDFRLDILAEDGEGSPVLIENQFGNTDHKHLGQLISYLASQPAHATVVWIAERIKDDHRAAIDWLNTNTTDGFDFFAVEIEALRIGSSEPAPFFNVVAKPNNWARAVSAVTRQSSTGELAGRHHKRLAYWASFAEFLRTHRSNFNIRRPNKDHWYEFSIGRSGIKISDTISFEKKRVGVELYISNDPLKQGIRQLATDREAIEKEYGAPLEWQELPNKKASRIAEYRRDIDPNDVANFPAIHQWMLDRMGRFQRVFTGRVKSLLLSAEATSEGDEEQS